jgi:hypothetical protein
VLIHSQPAHVSAIFFLLLNILEASYFLLETRNFNYLHLNILKLSFEFFFANQLCEFE